LKNLTKSEINKINKINTNTIKMGFGNKIQELINDTIEADEIKSQFTEITNVQKSWIPSNYIKSKGVCIEDTIRPLDWLVPSGVSVGYRDTTEKLFENGSIMFDVNASGWRSITKGINYDFTNVNTIAIAFFIDNQYAFDSFIIRLTTDVTKVNNYNDWSKYFEAAGFNTSLVLHRGWNFIKIHKSKFTNVGTETWGIFRAIRFIFQVPTKEADYGYTAFTGNTIISSKIGIGGIYLNPIYETPKFMLNFDDSSLYMFNNGFPYMRQKGVKATLFVCKNHVNEYGGGSWSMTEAQHDEWYASGNSIGNHSVTHSSMFSLTEQQIHDEYKGCRDYLISKGWATGAYLSAPPMGRYTNTSIKVLRELGYKFVRGCKNFLIDGIYPDNILNFPTYEIKGSTLLSTTLGLIDKMIENSSSLSIFTHHVVVSSPDAYSTTIADFQALIDYLVIKRDAGLIEIVTMAEFYNKLTDKNITQRT
jgi:peptidoglycan/xylan/chitin deacetylase (PgdA/CDA1 family)